MKNLLHCCFFVFFLFLQSNIIAQNQSLIDSLLAVNEQVFTSPISRVQHHIKISNLYYGVNPNKMLEQSKLALEISQNADYQQGKADASRFCGIAFFTLGNFKEAEGYFSKALKIYENIENSKGIISSLSNLGSVNMVQNKYAEALRYYQFSLKSSNDAKDLLNMGITYGNIGVIYSELKKYDKALEHFQGGLNLHTQIDYGIGIATGLGNLGNVYFKTKDFSKAQSYYQQALEKNLSLSNSLGIAREYGNLGNTFLELGQHSEAYKNFDKALKINQNLKNKKGEAVNLQGIGNYFLRINQLEEALDFSKKANILAKEINIQDVSMETYNNLSQIYEKMANMTAAYENYKQYIGGNWGWNSLEKLNYFNDRTSSLFFGDGHVLRDALIYEDNNFAGQSNSVRADMRCFKNLKYSNTSKGIFSSDWNDRTSSIIVRMGTSYVEIVN